MDSRPQINTYALCLPVGTRPLLPVGYNQLAKVEGIPQIVSVSFPTTNWMKQELSLGCGEITQFLFASSWGTKTRKGSSALPENSGKATLLCWGGAKTWKLEMLINSGSFCLHFPSTSLHHHSSKMPEVYPILVVTFFLGLWGRWCISPSSTCSANKKWVLKVSSLPLAEPQQKLCLS